jgi:hypothetical protein
MQYVGFIVMYLQSSVMVNVFMRPPSVIFRVDNYVLVGVGINGLEGTGCLHCQG